MTAAEGVVASALERCAEQGSHIAIVLLADSVNGLDVLATGNLDNSDLANLFGALAARHQQRHDELVAAQVAKLKLEMMH